MSTHSQRRARREGGRLWRLHMSLSQRKREGAFCEVSLKALARRSLGCLGRGAKISGKDPDFHRRDLWEAIENGDFPEYEFGVQIVQEKDGHRFDFDLLDPTKIIPEEVVPVQRMGKLTLAVLASDGFDGVALNPSNAQQPDFHARS